jgi:hypothetical protein
MKIKQLIHKLLSIILILSMTLGCGFFGSLATATPNPNQEFLNAINQGPKTVTPEQVNQAEQALFTSMREQSGARAAFGDQADAIFLKMDQDASAAMDEMVNLASGAVVPPLKVSPLITNPGSSGTTRASPLATINYWTKSMVLSLIELIGVPNVANLQRSDTGNVDGPITERGDPNGTGDYYFFQPKFIGSRMEATGRLRMANVTQFVGNGVYNESVGYTFSMELCPDAQGNVPLQFSFKSTVGQPGAGEQVSVVSQATGHVNDEGKLDSYENTSTFQGARQRTDLDPRFNNIFFEFQERSTQYTSNNNPATYDGNYTRHSVVIDYDFGTETSSSLRLIESFLIHNAFEIAETKWSTGYCVEIQVPELGTGVKSVQPNSDTSFTANVHHRFEGVDLQVPVIAMLSDGQVSVSPSGSKVPAPASFKYKAADREGQPATVHLETRSKRGIATLDLKFTTGVPTWTGEGTYTKAGQSSGIEGSMAYTFTITFHMLPDGTIAGEGVLKKTSASNSGQGMVCKDLGTTSALIFPPLKVSGTVKPDGTFQLNLVSQPSTNTWKWECSMSYAGINIGTEILDEGADLGPPTLVFEIAATDGAQANGLQDLSGIGGTTGSATWTLQIHKQAVP